MSDLAPTASTGNEPVELSLTGNKPEQPTPAPDRPAPIHPSELARLRDQEPEEGLGFEAELELQPVLDPAPAPVAPVEEPAPWEVDLDEETTPAQTPGEALSDVADVAEPTPSWGASVGIVDEVLTEGMGENVQATFEAPIGSGRGRPRKDGAGTGNTWPSRLTPLLEHPSRWVKISFAGEPRRADHAATAIRGLQRKRRLPGLGHGIFEVTARRVKGEEISHLYVRFLPFTEQERTDWLAQNDPHHGVNPSPVAGDAIDWSGPEPEGEVLH